MGAVFSFVGSDVKAKIDILEDLSNSSDGHHFTSVKKMITFEKEENLLKKKDYVSGSRTLLRLHRGLGKIMGVDCINSCIQSISCHRVVKVKNPFLFQTSSNCFSNE